MYPYYPYRTPPIDRRTSGERRHDNRGAGLLAAIFIPLLILVVIGLIGSGQQEAREKVEYPLVRDEAAAFRGDLDAAGSTLEYLRARDGLKIACRELREYRLRDRTWRAEFEQICAPVISGDPPGLDYITD